MLNLAQERQPAQALVLPFPKKGRQTMTGIEEGYTRLPNLLIDSEIMADLSDKAFKCLMFILRQTLGFGRNSHTISITQFQKYCGLKKRDTAISAIQELEECLLVEVVRKKGCLNEYSLTLNQYRKTGLVPSNGTSTIKQDVSSPVKGDGGSPAKQDTIKENFKENIKENNKNKAPADFVPQDRGALNFIDYHSDDLKLYTLEELAGKYHIKNDFISQAKVSFPKLEEKTLLHEINRLARWSGGKPARRSQAWMVTWLDWLNKIGSDKPQAAKQPKAEQPKRHRYGQGVVARGES